VLEMADRSMQQCHFDVFGSSGPRRTVMLATDI
jgi:hypothetical protein